VNEACSGVRSLQTSLMIGLLFGELKRFNLARRLGLLAGAIGIALVANFLRALFLVWVAANKGLPETERWHDTAGYVIVGLVFIGTMGLARVLTRGKVESRKAKVENEADSGMLNVQRAETQSAIRNPELTNSSTFYFLISTFIWLIAVEIAAAGWYWSHERNIVTNSTWKIKWPTTAPGYHEIKIAEGVRGTLRFDEGQQATWQMHDANSAASPVYLFFFRWEPGSSSVVRARAHRPDICLPSVGWHQAADLGVRTYTTADGQQLPIRHTVFNREKQNVVAHTFFCLQEDKSHVNESRPDLLVTGGAQPDWGLRGRTEIVRKGVRNLGQQVLEIVIVSASGLSDQAAEERFGEIARNVVVSR